MSTRPLTELVSAGAFAGDTPDARERAARRWAEKSARPIGQAEKIGGEWMVRDTARLPGGLTVEAFNRGFRQGDKLGGFHVPAGALDDWSCRDNQRFLDTWELIRYVDERRKALPTLDEGKFQRVIRAERGEWCREHGLTCSLGAIGRYRRRVNPASGREFDGNVDRRGRRTKQAESCSPEAWEKFLTYRQQENKPTTAKCWELVVAEAEQRGWKWPSVRTIQLRVAREIPKPLDVLTRQGESAFEAQCLPRIQREYEQLPAGAWYCLDCRKTNLMARVPDARTGWRWTRPVLAGVLDVRSRKLIGWALGATENADLILSASRMAFEQGGIPQDLTQDNGSGYKVAEGKSKRGNPYDDPRIGGLHAQLGYTLHSTIPYAAWSKIIESIWKTLSEFDRWFWSYWGASVDDRPEAAQDETLRRIDELPTLSDVRALFERYLEAYHASPQRGEGMFGLSPNLVWEQYRESARKPADPALLELLVCRTVGPVRASRNGIRYNNVYYGRWNETVWNLQGRDVWLRIHPEQADYVVVCDAKGVPICRAENDRMRGATQDDVRDAARIRARYRRATKEAVAHRDFMLTQSTSEQIMDLKRRRAKAVEAKLRANLPPAVAPTVTHVARPELSAAAARIKPAASRHNVFDDLARVAGQAGGAEAAREDVGALFTQFAVPDPSIPAVEEASDWAIYAQDLSRNKDVAGGSAQTGTAAG